VRLCSCARQVPGSCQVIPGGTGVANSDFHVFVHATASGCGSSVIAFASSCQTDQDDRPIFAVINFCPAALPASYQGETAQYNSIFATGVHEMFHALGFSTSNFPFFRNADGSPKTPRNPNFPSRLADANYM
jgi:leishmanolysin-like peptidase